MAANAVIITVNDTRKTLRFLETLTTGSTYAVTISGVTVAAGTILLTGRRFGVETLVAYATVTNNAATLSTNTAEFAEAFENLPTGAARTFSCVIHRDGTTDGENVATGTALVAYAGGTWTNTTTGAALLYKGDTGATGATGPKGDKGDDGEDGEDGEDGDVSQVLLGETMQNNPTQRQMTVALKKIWQALGGTIAVLAACLNLHADVTRATEWQDVPPDTPVSNVVDLANANVDLSVTNNYLPLTGGTLSGALNLENGRISFRDSASISFDVGYMFFTGASRYIFSYDGYTESALVPDGTPVVTSNMLASAVADTATKAELTVVTQTVAQVVSVVNAEDAKAVVTNYNSATKLPEFELSAKVTENGASTWLNLWKEMTRWNAFTGTNFDWTAWAGFHAFSTNLTHALNNKSDVLYAYYDGATGIPAPDGYFWISQPKVAICGGASYVRHLTTDGEVWILEANGTVTDVNTTTNGYFRISDSEGNVHFEIVKGDKRPVYAKENSMVMTNSTHYLVNYIITNAVSAPVAYAATNILTTGIGNFVAETDPDCPAETRWYKTSNGYNLEFWPKTTPCPSLYIYPMYEIGGESYIKNLSPVSMEYLYLFGQKWAVGTNTISGKIVLTLTPAN